MNFIKRTGGQAAWREGYLNRAPLSIENHDEWYWESYHDGLTHFYDMDAANRWRTEQVKNTKEVRAKFKQIREAHK